MAWSAPPRWLQLGWRDVAAHPGISLFYRLSAGFVSSLTCWKTHLRSMGLLVGPLPGHATWHAYRGSVRWL